MKKKSPTSRLTRPEFKILIALSMIQFTHVIDFMIIMPLGADLMDAFKIEPSQFGMLVSVYTFSAGIAGLLSALFIDKFERKKLLLITYIGFIAGTLACGLAPDFYFMLLSRVITGAFGGITGALIFSIMGDIIEPHKRGEATGIIMASFSLASILGVPLGLALGEWLTWHAPFLALGGISLLILFWSQARIPTVRDHLDKVQKNALARITLLLWDFHHVRTLLFTMFMITASFMVIPYISPYLVYNAGLPRDYLKFMYLLGGFFTFFSSRFIGKLTDKYGTRSVFTIMALLSMIPILMVTRLGMVHYSIIFMVTTLFFVLVSGRMVPGLALLNESILPENRGSFLSLNMAIQNFSMAGAALLAGFIVTKGDNGMLFHYPIAGYVGVFSTLIAIFLAHTIRRLQPT